MRARPALLAFLALAAPGAWAEAPRPAYDTRPDFERFDPDYVARRKAARAPLPGLAAGVRALEAARSPATRCAQQRLSELRVTLRDTAAFDDAARQAEALRALLAAPEAEAAPDGPDAEGAFGRCHARWYLRLDASYDVISERRGPLDAPARFLDRVATPRAITAYFDGLSVSDIAREGVDHRRELNYALSDLTRLVLRDQPVGYPWPEGMKDAVRRLALERLRDPATAAWGPRYLRDGVVTFVPDVSVTFHVVKYLGGRVPDWPKLVDTLLAIRDLRYPQGWREDDGFLAHDLYDVASLFRLGWAEVDEARHAAMAAAMDEMLRFALTRVVSPAGEVRVEEGDDSAETATYFAVGLLGELGAFDPAKRVWTTRDVPDGRVLGARIAARIRATLAEGGGVEGGTYYRDALARLAADGVP